MACSELDLWRSKKITSTRVWNTVRWRMLFRLLFNKRVLATRQQFGSGIGRSSRTA
jgi:hypothetical protein